MHVHVVLFSASTTVQMDSQSHVHLPFPRYTRVQTQAPKYWNVAETAVLLQEAFYQHFLGKLCFIHEDYMIFTRSADALSMGLIGLTRFPRMLNIRAGNWLDYQHRQSITESN